MTLANAKVRAQALIADGESFTFWMYLDSVSQVTIGYGTMMPNAASAQSVDLRHADKKRASDGEKAAEWVRLRALSAAGTALNFSAGHYRKDARLFITHDEGERLMLLKLDAFIADLRKIYAKFDTFPEDAQVALMDMIYNLGWRVKTVFVNFTKAINDPAGPDWKLAASRSRRPQLSDARNRMVRDLFLAAARTHELERRNRPGAPVRVPSI